MSVDVWLGSVGGVTVEHYQVGYAQGSPSIPSADPLQAVQHTTEGGWTGSHQVFLRHYAPTFMVGRDEAGKLRVAQYVAIGRMAQALEHPSGAPYQTNGAVMAQIELVGYSQTQLWRPDAGVTDLLGAVYSAIEKASGVPLKRGGNGTRSVDRWLHSAGWFGHGEVPWQPSGHWDPGQLDYAAVFHAAQRHGHRAARREYGVWISGPIGRGRVIDSAVSGHGNVERLTTQLAPRLVQNHHLPRLKYVKKRQPPTPGKRL